MSAPFLLRRVVAVVGLLSLAACAADGPLGRLARAPSPHEQYRATLERVGLHETALGRDWARAGDEALEQALAATLPFRETGYFPPETPSAAAYRFDLPRGRRLAVDVEFDSLHAGRLFVDLFELQEGRAPVLVASLDPDAATLTHDVSRDATYVLRIQPELLRGGRFTVVERTLASLVFPVPGLSIRAVQSMFGATRDAGRRAHEGIDIFAPRGTPAVAVADGMAQRSTNNLGGNVVWLYDRRRGLTFYYAHLDSWAIDGSTTVRAGDVLGYVGNTGNARTTAPHLHFGIYQRGAIDPLPFVQPDDPVPPPVGRHADLLGALVRVVPARTPLRAAAGARAPVSRQLDRASVARVLGASQTAVRVVLPDRTVGYVDAAAVTRTDTAVRRQPLAAGAVVREHPFEDAPVVEVLAEALTADVIGRFGAFDLVRVADGRQGWVDVTPARPARPTT